MKWNPMLGSCTYFDSGGFLELRPTFLRVTTVREVNPWADTALVFPANYYVFSVARTG